MRFFFLKYTLPFIVALSFYGIFRIWEKICKILATNFSPLFHLRCYREVGLIFTFTSDYTVKLLKLKRLRSSEKKQLHVKIVVPKLQNLIFRVTRRDVLLVHCIVANVPISPQNHKIDLIYQIAKKHSTQKLDVTFKCKLCYQTFPGLYALRQHRNTQHGKQIGSVTRDVDVEHIVGDVEDQSFREELRLTFLVGF